MDVARAFVTPPARRGTDGEYARTTPLGTNVFGYESLTKRARGGSRPGLSKYPSGQVPAGATLIQELNSIVVINPNVTGALAAVGFVQQNSKRYHQSVIPDNGTTSPSSGAETCAFTSNVTAGYLLIVCFSHDTLAGGDTFSVADTRGTVYTLAESAQSSSATNQLRVYWGIAPTSGANTVTVTRSFFADACTVGVLEFSGIRQIAPIDDTSENNQDTGSYGAGTDNVTTGTITVNNSGSMVLAAFSQGFDDSADIWAPGTGWTQAIDQSIDTVEATQSLHVEYRSSNASIAGLATVSGAIFPQIVSIGLSMIPASAWIQASTAGRQSLLLSVAGGEIQTCVAGHALWTPAINNSGTTPALYYSATDQRRVYSAQNGEYVYFADGNNWRRFHPLTNVVSVWSPSAGTLPVDDAGTKPRLICTWRGRTVLSGVRGASNNIYMSKVDDPTDFDYDPPTRTVKQAVSGNNSDYGLIGDTVTTLIPYSDDVLLVGGDHSIWMIQGDPADGGRPQRVSDIIGMAWGKPWCKSPSGEVYFFANQPGMWRMVPGQQPVPISQPIRPEILATNTGTQTITLAWDDLYEGVWCFITNTGSISSQTHWFYETRAGAWWKVTFTTADQNPQCATVFDGNLSTDRVTVIGSWDGYVRALSPDATTDDGVAIAGEVWLGPLLGKELEEILMNGFKLNLGETTGGTITYAVHVGSTPEVAYSSTAVRTGTPIAGRNLVAAERWSGNAIYLKITTTGRWGYEQGMAWVKSLGPILQRAGV